VHLHGGAYLLGFPAVFRDFTWRIADVTGARVLCIDYRLAPEHPFPAAIEDVTAAYRWLIAECAEPRHVAIARPARALEKTDLQLSSAADPFRGQPVLAGHGLICN
jgi:alpha/beta hydrolase fold